MISHNYITASKAAATIVTLLLLLTVGGGDLYSASAINYSSSSKQQLRHRRQNTPAAKKTATTTTQEQRGLNSYNNDDGYDTNSIFKTEKDTKCTRSITNHNHGRNCIMTCQTTTFVYTHDDILLDKTVSENSVRKCTYDEEEIMVESDEGSSTHEDGYDDGLEFDVWRGGGNDDSWKCSTKKRTWQVSNNMRERERERRSRGVLGVCSFISTLLLKNTCFLKYVLYLKHRVQHSRKMKILHGRVHLPRR